MNSYHHMNARYTLVYGFMIMNSCSTFHDTKNSDMNSLFMYMKNIVKSYVNLKFENQVVPNPGSR